MEFFAKFCKSSTSLFNSCTVEKRLSTTITTELFSWKKPGSAEICSGFGIISQLATEGFITIRSLLLVAVSEQELKQQKIDYLVTFSSKEGERVLADLTSAYYHRSSFSKDPYETAFKEGQRAVIVRIINLLKEDKTHD